MKKQTKLILLILWCIVAAAIYFAAIQREIEVITPIYAVLSTLSGVGFFLVNGGVRAIVKADSAPEAHDALSKKQKARLRYQKSEKAAALPNAEPPRANIFRLSPQKQKLWAELLIIVFIAPTAVLIIDYLLIAFIPSYT